MNLPKCLITDLFSDRDWEHNHWYWTPPSVPDFAGPSDLSKVLISYREKHREITQETGKQLESFGHISDARLEDLLTYAYRASYVRDEGRYVLARLYVPEDKEPSLPHPHNQGKNPLSTIAQYMVRALAQEHQKKMDSRIIHRFATPVSLDDRKIVAQLAQTLRTEDSALLVQEIDGTVRITGICILDNDDSEHLLLEMPRKWSGGGLLVYILGPGDLKVSEGGKEYTLRANELLIHDSASFTKPTKEWLFQLSKSLVKECEKSQDWNAECMSLTELKSEFPLSDVMLMWSRILQEAVHMRHGGAFVVMPTFEQTTPIDLKFPLQAHDLGREIVNAWLALSRAWRNDPEIDHLNRIEDKRLAVHRLLNVTKSVAALSATDGCVVLDRQMVLHGFGGSIKANREYPNSYRDLTTDSELATKELLVRFGERHKSALALVAHLRGSIAFVISQDGDLRLFASDTDHVYFGDYLQA